MEGHECYQSSGEESLKKASSADVLIVWNQKPALFSSLLIRTVFLWKRRLQCSQVQGTQIQRGAGYSSVNLTFLRHDIMKEKIKRIAGWCRHKTDPILYSGMYLRICWKLVNINKKLMFIQLQIVTSIYSLCSSADFRIVSPVWFRCGGGKRERKEKISTYLASVETLEMPEQTSMLFWDIAGCAIANENFTSWLKKIYRCHCFQSKHLQERLAQLSMSHSVNRQRKSFLFWANILSSFLFLLISSTSPSDESVTYIWIKELQKRALESNELRRTQDVQTALALLCLLDFTLIGMPAFSKSRGFWIEMEGGDDNRLVDCQSEKISVFLEHIFIF